MTKKKGMCLLVSNESRDFYLLIAAIYYLEHYEDYTISFEFVWDAHKIKKEKPELVILPNERGNNLYVEIAAYCKQNNILVLSHDSEGNFNSEIDYDFWGYNLSKEVVCPIVYTWNERVKTFLHAKYNINNERFCLSGAPGFDKYNYLPKIDKYKLLKKYKLEHFTHIVGYAGWAFGKLYNKELVDLTQNLNMSIEAGKNWLENQRDQVEECLQTVIERFPDVLFILKKHPRENFESDYRDSRNEMNRLAHYPNVLYLKDQEDIQDLIQISDLWMAFESTSIMEAWLMNVPTLMINPDSDFTRASFHHGSATVKNSTEIEAAFDQLFRLKDSSFFFQTEILDKRMQIIQAAIGYNDGFNHLRVINAIKPFLAKTKPPQKTTTNWRFLRRYVLLHIGKMVYNKLIFERLPKFKKTIWLFENYRLQELKAAKEAVYPHLDAFYQKHQLPHRIETGQLWEELRSSVHK